MLRNNTATHRTLRLGRTGVGIPLPRRVFFFANLAGRTNARSTRKRLVPAEAPVTVNTQVHVQGQVVVEGHEQVLAVRVRPGNDVTVQQGGTLGVAALRGGNLHALAREDVADLAGNTVDGVAFGHGFSSKTCRLESARNSADDMECRND